jgi:hypothetical protein
MNAQQHEALEKFLAAMADLADTLARDDLGAFDAAIAKLPPLPEDFPKVSAPSVPAADLAAARRSFLPLSEAAANYAMQVRGHFPKLRIFRCPMSQMAGEGIPKNAKWIQLSANLRNPFLGQEMLGCGTEVK